ncbi:GNAT family protein [Chryseobacterium indologenes]
MERIGLRKEGHFVKSLFWKNKWVDDIIYAVLREEWPTK